MKYRSMRYCFKFAKQAELWRKSFCYHNKISFINLIIKLAQCRMRCKQCIYTLMREKNHCEPQQIGVTSQTFWCPTFYIIFYICLYTHMHACIFWLTWDENICASFFVYHGFLNKMLYFCGALNLLNFAALNLLVLYLFPLWLVLPSSSPKARIYVFYFLILYINMF